MAKPERQQQVQDLLQELRGIEPLKKLFWSELNYQRVNEPLSRRGWPEPASNALAYDPVLFASGGDGGAFHVIYCRLTSKNLSRGLERPVVTQLLREHPYALFIFSDKSQTDWHFLNVKFDDQSERRQLYRRITVRPGAGLRTATERVQLLDLAEIHPELFGITPLAIQQRCDAAFDVETVTKDFFTEVANWYFWALKNAKFPKDAPKEADGHDHISIIRLITRLIFCWFVKEKGLIPDTLFDQQKLAQFLTGFEPAKASAKQSVFYKAILQNLFFATLNTEMDKRAWRKEDANFMAHILYRHKTLFQKPGDALDLFKDIPFLNGGLFECLDKREGTAENPKDIRIDGFSDRSDSQPIVPDFLFFGAEREVDLSEEYDNKKFKSVPVRGLIHIFNRYNFTVEEDTPIDQEVALDPELSGKVFENLLAAYNPETGATARKQTGSFYTPREIVNYMVDESLIACLKTKLETALPSAKDVENRLRQLFAYTDEPHQFAAPEVDALIAAIDSLKTLDPAVGSGAFPMGILHKLVFILGKLDPRNEKWKERQIARVRDTMATAEKIEDATARERAVRELEQQINGINEAFEHNELDYGRKLYLIENCIYGVDIQTIAVQIAKMRFFISLIVDQKIDNAQHNRGVRPLPNLETKFVAANTLIGINRPGQQLLRNREIDAQEAELRHVRQRHFDAKTPKQKAKCRDDDTRLRTEIAELLKGDGWDTATARKLASWNPYEQNTSADFFDPEWMFGLVSGFDVVIGNPPYLFLSGKGSPVQQLRKLGKEADAELLKQVYDNIAKRFPNSSKGCRDYYKWFIEAAFLFTDRRGLVSYITPNTFFTLKNYEDVRDILLRVNSTDFFLDLGFGIFEVPIVPSAVFQARRSPNISSKVSYADLKEVSRKDLLHTSLSKIVEENLNHVSVRNADILLYKHPLAEKLYQNCVVRLGEVAAISEGEHGMVVDPSRFETSQGRTRIPAIHDSLLNRYSESPVVYIPNADCPEYDKTLHSGPRFLLRKTGDSIVAGFPATFDLAVAHQNVYVGHSKVDRVGVFAIVGFLCSKLLTFLYQNGIHGQRGRTLAQFRIYALNALPFPELGAESHDLIQRFVKQVLDIKRKSSGADTSALEREIDKRVYALYGLTPEEIKIVEAAS